ncbi:HAD family hydrolase [bacterium]|nr:HAD family hydrolase [bacterium]
MINLKTKNWKLKNIELVIFDKDGTFIDIHKYWGRVVELRAKEIIRYFGLKEDFYKPLCEVMGYDMETCKLPPDSPVGLYARGKVQEILLYFLLSHNIEASIEDIENIFQTVGKEFLKEQEEYTVTIDDAVRLIENLHEKKCKMIVITSDSRENAIHTVKKRGLDKYFKGIFGAEDSKEPKTTGDIVKKVLTKLKVEPEKTVCIGDTYDDFLMAKNSRIKACINVSTGVVTETQQKEYNDFAVASLSEIEVET